MQNNTSLLYQVQQIRKLEKIAIKKFGLSINTLMYRAGKSAFDELQKRWPRFRNITVVCGKGNNAGDGYMVAYFAKLAKFKVKILSLVPYDCLDGAVKDAASRCKKLKINTQPFASRELIGSDLIVDAIFGTGLTGEITSKFKMVINTINASKIPVLALDVPSGIDADTGKVLGVAICASITVTFVGNKIGLLIGEARNYCGDVVCNSLSLFRQIFRMVAAYAERLTLTVERKSLPPRYRTAHKGNFGHVLVIGGDYGMGGAVRMAGEAALRVGAGLVTVATRGNNALLINAVCPEIMVYGVNTIKQLEPLLKKASVIAVGPGLGQSKWGRSLFSVILKTEKPLVIDADALNILSSKPKYKDNWILTPHPGEAARLLDITTRKIQVDRLESLQRIQKIFGGVCILKGAGTLIGMQGEKIRVCDVGNPGMASAGMGDILTGMLAGLLAQGLSLFNAAKLGVLVHALAGDIVATKHGKIGILAMDLLPEVRSLLNK
ncbi:MAG: NAD(P)H-hydrate dehydratase [Coxiellaceae bacterium]|jgi:NAD(P)H-hydrate epimerase|nr:NAD(P)H-hydrate dehydratase [Coxiellaceae bacterium]